MGRLDKAYVHNAGKRDPAKPQTIFYGGKRRKQIYPSGTVERMVNLQGTVVQMMLVPPGVPVTPEAVASKRTKLKLEKTHDGDVQGFIEHAKCPLINGTRHLTPLISAEFDKLPQNLQSPCKEHPVTFKRTAKGIEYFDGCPHIEWLIQGRRALHKTKTDARRKRQKSVLQMEQEKVDLMREQAEATTKILERVADRLDKPRKATPE
jgi:hypothetical protein